MSAVVDGLPARGNAQDAKFKDFTACEVADKYYKCIANRTVSIYGVPAEKAYVLISRESHTYSGIHLLIEPQKYDADCLKKVWKPYFIESKPEECMLPSGMSNLKLALDKNEWIESPKSFQNQHHFYNRNYSVRIILNKHGSQNSNRVLIDAVQDKFAMIQWKEAKVVHDRNMAIRKQEEALREKEEASKPTAEAFINSMKQQ